MTQPSGVDRLLSASLTQAHDLAALYNAKLKATGLSNTHVSRLLDIDRNTLNPIIKGTAKQPNLVALIKIAEFLELDFDDLLAAFLRGKTREEVKSLADAKKASFITRSFDLPRLKSVGFLSRVDDLAFVEQRLCEYFGIMDVYAFERLESPVLYSRTKVAPGDLMIDFWLKSAYGYFERLQQDRPYDRDLLKAIVPKIRGYTRNEKTGLPTVIRALYNAGVTVLFQPHLTKTQVRGATIAINDRPCVVITDLNKNYATIWFALAHELGHVLYDFELIKDQAFHLTGAEDLFLVEDKANAFARQLLFPDERMRYIEPLIHNPLVVAQYAEESGVHPSTIYSFYQYKMAQQGQNYWGAFKEHFPDIGALTQNLNQMLWTDESIEASAQRIKDTLRLT